MKGKIRNIEDLKRRKRELEQQIEIHEAIIQSDKNDPMIGLGKEVGKLLVKYFLVSYVRDKI